MCTRIDWAFRFLHQHVANYPSGITEGYWDELVLLLFTCLILMYKPAVIPFRNLLHNS